MLARSKKDRAALAALGFTELLSVAESSAESWKRKK
jgi:hypothetical protein